MPDTAKTDAGTQAETIELDERQLAEAAAGSFGTVGQSGVSQDLGRAVRATPAVGDIRVAPSKFGVIAPCD